MDYKNGKIYCIRNIIDDEVYVGSTCQPLSKRMSFHRNRLKRCNKNRKLYGKMNEIGVDKFYIELIEECPCDNKEQLRKREGHFIREIGTLNMLIAGRTKKEYKNDNKEKIKEKLREYREKNKDEIKEKQREYREKNKDEIKEKLREYYDKNKDEIKEKKREYYDKNKDEIKEKKREYQEKNKDKIREYREKNKDELNEKRRIKITCGCGSCYNCGDKARHEKTKKHKEWLETQQ